MDQGRRTPAEKIIKSKVLPLLEDRTFIQSVRNEVKDIVLGCLAYMPDDEQSKFLAYSSKLLGIPLLEEGKQRLYYYTLRVCAYLHNRLGERFDGRCISSGITAEQLYQCLLDEFVIEQEYLLVMQHAWKGDLRSLIKFCATLKQKPAMVIDLALWFAVRSHQSGCVAYLLTL